MDEAKRCLTPVHHSPAPLIDAFKIGQWPIWPNRATAVAYIHIHSHGSAIISNDEIEQKEVGNVLQHRCVDMAGAAAHLFGYIGSHPPLYAFVDSFLCRCHASLQTALDAISAPERQRPETGENMLFCRSATEQNALVCGVHINTYCPVYIELL